MTELRDVEEIQSRNPNGFFSVVSISVVLFMQRLSKASFATGSVEKFLTLFKWKRPLLIAQFVLGVFFDKSLESLVGLSDWFLFNRGFYCQT